MYAKLAQLFAKEGGYLPPSKNALETLSSWCFASERAKLFFARKPHSSSFSFEIPTKDTPRCKECRKLSLSSSVTKDHCHNLTRSRCPIPPFAKLPDPLSD